MRNKWNCWSVQRRIQHLYRNNTTKNGNRLRSKHKNIFHPQGASRQCRKKKTPGACFSGKRNIKVYKTNLFKSGPTKIITSDVETCSKVNQGMLKAHEHRNKLLQKIAKTRFLRKSDSLNLFTNYMAKCRYSNKKTVKMPRTIAVLKENIQAIGLLVKKNPQ